MISASIPPDPAFGHANALLALIADPVATAERVKALQEASAEARAVIDEANQKIAAADAKMADCERDIARREAESDQKIVDSQNRHAQAMHAREQELKGRELNAAQDAAAAKIAREEAEQLRADLRRRLDAISAAAA